MSTAETDTIKARAHAIALLNASLIADEDLSIENRSALPDCRWLVTFGYYGDSETERYGVLYRSRGHSADGAADRLTEETPAFPVALYDLDDIGAEPEISYGDLVEHEGERLHVVSDDYEGIEGEPQRVLTLHEDPDSEGFGITVHDYEAKLVQRHEDFEDPRTPRRYALAAWKVSVVFNTAADSGQVTR